MSTKIEQLQQKKAAIEKAISLEKTKAKSAQRRQDARRKVLIGAFVLEQLQKNGIGAASLTYEGKHFSEWLIREDERSLFGLSEPTKQGDEKGLV